MNLDIERKNQEICPFKLHKQYRREQVKNAIGSNQEIVGIFWGNKFPNRVVCTAGGAKAEKFGFADRELEDGTWYYYGQGTKGNQDWNVSNKIVKDRKIWLFKTHAASEEEKLKGINKNWYEFKGSFCCDSWQYEIPESGIRKGDQMIRFHLVKLNT